jgi:CxxC motif-containing protein (DUF1111 family)
MQSARFSLAGRRWKCLAGILVASVSCLAQHDPGPRPGPAGAGGTFTVLDNTNAAADRAKHDYFLQSLERFQEVDSVSGTITPGVGLGPAFNHNSCAACHIQPAIGGSSPVNNPQVVNNFAHLNGASNPVNTSQFLSATGPIREVRFVSSDPTNTYAGLDGGVHDVFTIAGRTDAPGCNLQQPNFPQQIAAGNVIFRIPTPLFGAGLVEMVSDSALVDNLNATASQRSALGIGGRFNTNGNDGTITRFGWKAQNKSLLIFSGEAYNVEQGVTNELFQSDRFPPGTPDSVIANCTFNTSPEDTTNVINGQANTIVGGVTKPNPNFNTPVGTASEMSSDAVNFAAFISLLAPATPTTHTASELNGKSLFSSIGCQLCHSPTLVTDLKNGNGAGGGADSLFPALAGFTFHPYSDFAVHHMGSTLTDGVNQGGAGPDEFRSAPLWGIGQRIFFLHDGRTNDLLAAIQAHSSSGNICVTIQDFQQFTINGGISYFQPFTQSQNCGSEANNVIAAFNGLNSSQKQDILNFLRSL